MRCDNAQLQLLSGSARPRRKADRLKGCSALLHKPKNKKLPCYLEREEKTKRNEVKKCLHFMAAFNK